MPHTKRSTAGALREFAVDALRACEQQRKVLFTCVQQVTGAQQVEAQGPTHVPSCVERAVLPLLTLPSNADVLEYFYGAPAGLRFRLPGCVSHAVHRSTGDFIWWPARDKQGALRPSNATNAPCFWGNMVYSKTIAIVLLARLLNVTHIVESGRMGGISLTHYHAFGFNLTSIELRPLEHVQDDLQNHLPAARLLSGDGGELMPSAISEIRASAPAARVMAIIDGPKGSAALRLAQRVASEAALVVVDDMDARHAWGERGLAFYTLSDLWLAALPRERDFELSEKHAPQRGTADRSYFFFPLGATVLWGDQWLGT